MDRNLQKIIDYGIVDLTEMQCLVEMNERKKYLNEHDYRIWQGKNGKWYTKVTENGKLKLIKRNSKADIDDAIVKFYKEHDEEPTLLQVINQWLMAKLEVEEIKKQTYDRYVYVVKQFIADTELAETKMRYIDDADLEEYVKSIIHDYKLTAKAYSSLRTILRGSFKYAKKRGYTNISITEFFGDLELSRKMFSKKQKSDNEQVFTDTEVLQLINHFEADNSLIGFGIILAFMTGLRCGELVALKREDVTSEGLLVRRVEEHYKVDGKIVYEVVDGAKTDAGIRTVYLTDEARRVVKKLIAMNPFGEYIFMHDGKRYNSPAFTKKLVRACNTLRITPRSLHKCRKTYATKLIKAGIDEKTIQKQMGHTDISTTKRYYYFDNSKKNEKSEALEKAISY